MSTPYITLGPRSTQILRLLVAEAREGREPSNRRIAEAFGISEGTVQTLIHRMAVRFGVRNKHELVLFFLSDRVEERSA